MKLEGSIPIAAHPARVWDAIVDPVSLASCVPGVTTLEQVDASTFTGSITAAVGPIQGDFAFTSVLTEATFPDRLVVSVTGSDSVTRSRVSIQLQAAVEQRDGGTDLAYRATVTVDGRLAILGEMVLRAAAGVIIGQVTRCLRAHVESALPPEAAARHAAVTEAVER